MKKNRLLQFKGLIELGLQPVSIDLKKYFGKKDELLHIINDLGGIWVTGGNAFVLRTAYKLSGLDEIIEDLTASQQDFVYSGFSAGCCVLQKSFRGLEFVDDPADVKVSYGKDKEVIWNGLGLIDYVFVPHFESDHEESEVTNDEIKYYDENNIVYKTLRDGEVIIDEINKI
ncbi:MAG: Type 1 glutamine amidotransferase-like domain-containing protein [Candidatus Dojkabacteria bacterium]|nr:Type 1 glutamine amidotransferase-like domain-containing protein [Candidatus Dojkabacteria bacterium]MDQ7020546.1 Type 1 glutamine amidotransferase-like domain-containing protein [Candidatus Dojkabacteria bacterium]